MKDTDVKDLLEGKTLQEAVAASKLWIMDYYEPYKGFISRIDQLNKSAVLYCGKCYLYTRLIVYTLNCSASLQKTSVPMAIPLFSPF